MDRTSGDSDLQKNNVKKIQEIDVDKKHKDKDPVNATTKETEKGEDQTRTSVPKETETKESVEIPKGGAPSKELTTSQTQTSLEEVALKASGSKTDRMFVTPKDQIKSGEKPRRRRRKQKHALKDEKKQQSPVMKRLTDFFPVRRSGRKCRSTIETEEKRQLEESILSGKEEGLEVREIIGKGRGVIAMKEFKKGQFVVEYHGELIDVTKAKRLETQYGKDPSIGCYMYYFEFKNKRYCVDATKETGRLGRLLNHSKSGNCCTRLVSIKEKPHLILVAKRDIAEGEELLYDYGDRNKEVLQSHPWLAS